MAIKSLKKIFISETEAESADDVSRVLNIIQENVAQSLNPLIQKVQNDSTILTNVFLKAGQVNKINHTLGRKLLGYNVMLKGKPSTAIISNDQDSNSTPQLTLWLWTTIDATINLEVY